MKWEKKNGVSCRVREKKEEEWIGGAQQGFWGEETPIGKERTE